MAETLEAVLARAITYADPVERSNGIKGQDFIRRTCRTTFLTPPVHYQERLSPADAQRRSMESYRATRPSYCRL